MPLLLRLTLFVTLLSLLWVYQPAVLKQPDPATALAQQPSSQEPESQTIEGAFYQMNDQGVIWDIVAQKAILTNAGLIFHAPKASTQDGRLFQSHEAYWSFSEAKIFFTGNLVVIDPAKNIEMHATQAYYDIKSKELVFDEPLQGAYSGTL